MAGRKSDFTLPTNTLDELFSTQEERDDAILSVNVLPAVLRLVIMQGVFLRGKLLEEFLLKTSDLTPRILKFSKKYLEGSAK